MKVKTIEINGTRFALPAGITTKDVQALAGFLLTLEQVEYHWLSEAVNNLDRVNYLGGTPAVRLAEIEVVSKDEADQIYQSDRARRDARRAEDAQS